MRYPGQTSMMCITHRVFFLRVRKDPFDRFLPLGIKLLPEFRSPQLFDQV